MTKIYLKISVSLKTSFNNYKMQFQEIRNYCVRTWQRFLLGLPKIMVHVASFPRLNVIQSVAKAGLNSGSASSLALLFPLQHHHAASQ